MIDDCWNRIGVQGDGSCPELKVYAHCRNCPVHAAAARELLREHPPAGYTAEWTRHLALPRPAQEAHTQSVVIFRVGAEWLALPTTALTEVAEPKRVHSLPHRTGAVVLGITSVRGELLPCVSLASLLGIDKVPPLTPAGGRTVYPRLLVIRRDETRVVCPVDEVYGIHRFRSQDLRDLPATLAAASTRYCTTLLSWQQRAVGVLDDQMLFYSLRRSLA